jgi:hypothetical protein
VYEKFGITGSSEYLLESGSMNSWLISVTDIAEVGKKVVEFYKGKTVVSPLDRALNL